MTLLRAPLLGMILVLISGICEARDPSVVREFMKATPCPVEGLGSCFAKGYEVEHPIALVCGGRDHVSNLTWLNRATHRIKTRYDNARCKGTWFGFWARTWRAVRYFE